MDKHTLLKHVMQSMVVLWFAVMTAVSTASEQPRNGTDAGADEPVAMPTAPVYKPPLRGAPRARVGGGTRGAGTQHVVLEVLVPDHAGLTTQAQPALYWYTEIPVAARFEITLIDEEGIDPLLELEIDKKAAAGIQRLDLREHAISLQQGVSYQWSVALVADTDNRSADLVASGVIERIETAEELSQRIRDSSGTALVNVYAGEGIWYDALDTLSTLIAKSPEDRKLANMRTALLDQVGLKLPDEGH